MLVSMTLVTDAAAVPDSELPPMFAIRAWLRIILSDDEAEAALSLPASLLLELYRDVIVYGPAGDELTVALERKEELEDSDEYASWVTRIKKLGRKADQSSPTHEGLANIKLWAKEKGYTLLEQRMYFLGSSGLGAKDKMGRFSERHAYAQGLETLYWFLNGQYLFPDALVKQLTPRILEVNEALRALDIGPLAGKFAQISLVASTRTLGE